MTGGARACRQTRAWSTSHSTEHFIARDMAALSSSRLSRQYGRYSITKTGMSEVSRKQIPMNWTMLGYSITKTGMSELGVQEADTDELDDVGMAEVRQQ